jgi:diamine N-acetyltransferase
MCEVSLRPITVDNWLTCIRLTVPAPQESFVPSNLYSIAEAQFYPRARSRAIYNRDEQMVGYTLYGIDVSTGTWKVFRLMIDQGQQGRGYGRAALDHIIADVAAQPDGTALLISYHYDNTVAHRLYSNAGFVVQSSTADHLTARLELRQRPDTAG